MLRFAVLMRVGVMSQNSLRLRTELCQRK